MGEDETPREGYDVSDTMGQGQGQGQPPTGQQQPPPPPPPDPLANLTPEQLAGLQALNQRIQSIAAAEKREGRTSVERELTEQLGMTPAEAAVYIQKAKEAEKALMTEAERKLAEATEREQKAIAREQMANVVALDMMKVSALTSAGMTQQQAQAAKGMLALPPGELEGDALLAGVAAAVENLKGTFPTLFPAPGDPPSNDQTGGNGTTRPPGHRPPPNMPSGGKGAGSGQGGKTAAERAEERLKRVHGDKIRTPGG